MWEAYKQQPKLKNTKWSNGLYASIEHILPQNADDSWAIDEEKQQQLAFRIGNTCLLEKRLNVNIKNNSFEAKRKVYASSSYLDAKTISGMDVWSENRIISRQSKMAYVAVNIWRVSNFQITTSSR